MRKVDLIKNWSFKSLLTESATCGWCRLLLVMGRTLDHQGLKVGVLKYNWGNTAVYLKSLLLNKNRSHHEIIMYISLHYIVQIIF